MGLSNTAVPKYYGKFRERVIAGEIPVCKEISMQMNRIDELIANPSFYYDEDKVEGWVRFCESELTLTDGRPLELMDSFKLWGEDVLGWYYFIEKSIYVPGDGKRIGHYERRTIRKRLVKKQYLIVGRGAAKTMYASTIHNYFLNVDTSTTQQITCAPTMALADEVLSPIRTSIARARGPLFKFLTEGSLNNTTGDQRNRQKLASTKKGIQNFLTGSILEIRPMSIPKLQGRHDRIATVDEWLSGDIKEDPIGAIEQGATKQEDYLIIATSSEGTVRNGPGDTIKMELMSILRGEYYNPHVSIWHYRLDDVGEVARPEMWVKANPNIGITVSYEAYQADVERAEKVPATRNDILAKRFGVPMEGHSYFFVYEETIPTSRNCEFWSQPCSLGLDLSQGDDFCAFTFLFPLRGQRFGVKARSYISERTLMRLPMAMRYKYEEFINEGSLIVMDGTILNMMEVYEDLDQYVINMNADVRSVGYDLYNAKEFIERWGQENGTHGIERVHQGSRTESVPLGEIKKLAADRALIFDQSIMQFCMGNCIVLEDTNGNRKLTKMRYEAKIDNVAALMDAFVAYKLHKDEFE